MAKTVDNLCPELIFVLSIHSDWVDQGKGGVVMIMLTWDRICNPCFLPSNTLTSDDFVSIILLLNQKYHATFA